MNTLFAAGLFDQPWLVAIIVIGGALVNWLAKRRQEKEAGQQSEGEPLLPDKPQGEPSLEEALRQLLGQESPPQQPETPPIIPRTATAGPPAQADWQDTENIQPEQTWREEAGEIRTEARETTVLTSPPVRSTPVVLARAGDRIIAPREERAQAARRFEQLNEAGRRPATVVHAGGGHTSVGTRPAYWRNPRNARQAFVASLVFGPPKSLET